MQMLLPMQLNKISSQLMSPTSRAADIITAMLHKREVEKDEITSSVVFTNDIISMVSLWNSISEDTSTLWPKYSDNQNYKMAHFIASMIVIDYFNIENEKISDATIMELTSALIQVFTDTAIEALAATGRYCPNLFSSISMVKAMFTQQHGHFKNTFGLVPSLTNSTEGVAYAAISPFSLYSWRPLLVNGYDTDEMTSFREAVKVAPMSEIKFEESDRFFISSYRFAQYYDFDRCGFPGKSPFSLNYTKEMFHGISEEVLNSNSIHWADIIILPFNSNNYNSEIEVYNHLIELIEDRDFDAIRKHFIFTTTYGYDEEGPDNTSFTYFKNKVEGVK